MNVAFKNRLQLVYQLRTSGVSDSAVLNALEKTDRAQFVPENFRDKAYDDTALPIADGQTITQPSLVGLMSQALEIQPQHKILEIGTGSGYQSAILSLLARRVYSLERYQRLAQEAKAVLEALNITNVIILNRDGIYGLEEQAPFERIIVTAASENIPPILEEQLCVGGKMLIPIGSPDRVQQLIKVTRTPQRYEYEELSNVRFVPLLENIVKG